jgi:hypothetical protein
MKLVPGDQIPSAFVRKDRQYLDGRKIENLAKVGALSADAQALLERADALPAGGPPDGGAHVDELVRLEQPKYAKALLPEERQVQPIIWKHLEWEARAPMSPPAPLPPLKYLVRDISEDAPEPVKGAGHPVTGLPVHLRPIARRAMAIAGLKGVNVTPAATERAKREKETLAPGEPEALKELAKIVAKPPPGPAGMRPLLRVPKPGTAEQELPLAGAARMVRRYETRITETRAWVGDEFTASLDITRSESLGFKVPFGHKLALIHLEKGREHVLDEGVHAAPKLSPGRYLAELWREGRRVESAEVLIPKPVAKDKLEMTRYVGYELVTPEGEPLFANVTQHKVDPVYAGYNYYGGYYGQRKIERSDYSATFEYGLERKPPSEEEAQAIKGVKLPAVGLPPGHYEVTDPQVGRVRLSVYPTGNLAVTLDELRYPLGFEFEEEEEGEDWDEQPADLLWTTFPEDIPGNQFEFQYEPSKKRLTYFADGVKRASWKFKAADRIG